jgi:hypothetical protein
VVLEECEIWGERFGGARHTVESERRLPKDPLAFIKDCVKQGQLYWTYHVNMRMEKRGISRGTMMGAAETFEVIESYPEDKYLPSYLVYGLSSGEVFHVLFAVDLENVNVRVVTAYHPDPSEWEDGLKRRRSP